MQFQAILVITLALLCCNPGAAAQRPCGQDAPCPGVSLDGPLPNPWPADDPDAVISLPLRAPPPGYVVEEYFMQGSGNVFNYNQPQAQLGAAPGDNLVIRRSNVSYRTRLVVVRPDTPARFNGTVIVEFLNSTAGIDGAVVWEHSGQWFGGRGIVYIGVTTSGDSSIEYLARGCGRTPDSTCGSRYRSLSMPDNGLEFEIVSQLASALKSGLPDQQPLPPTFRPIKHVFIAAYSQQAGSVLTMAAQFHQQDIDGYFPQGNGFARPISGSANGVSGAGTEDYCRYPNAQAYPNCIGDLAPGEPVVRTNLPVPLYFGMNETEVELLGPGRYRQPDTDTSPFASFRLFELPGVSHVVKRDGVDLERLCRNLPYYHDTPIAGTDVFNAYWEAMFQQVERGILPPRAPRIATDSDGRILRDAQGNALGGLRVPEFEFPKASYFSGLNSNKPLCTPAAPPDSCVSPGDFRTAAVSCLLAGSQLPFSAADLAARYPVRGNYAREFSLYTVELARQRLLLPEDARRRLIAVARGEM